MNRGTPFMAHDSWPMKVRALRVPNVLGPASSWTQHSLDSSSWSPAHPDANTFFLQGFFPLDDGLKALAGEACKESLPRTRPAAFEQWIRAPP